MAYQKVLPLSELPVGEARSVQVGSDDLALFHVEEGQVHAIANTCPHQGGPLAEGFVEGKVVTCPWHNWKFDVCTGKSTIVPDAEVQCFKAKVEDGDILVDV